jgi:hypothetical protein
MLFVHERIGYFDSFPGTFFAIGEVKESEKDRGMEK